MKSLKELKIEARRLRRHLATTFQQDVTLSRAYESLAAMYGVVDWNTLASMAMQAVANPLQVHPFIQERPKGTLILDVSLALPANRDVLMSVCKCAYSFQMTEMAAVSSLTADAITRLRRLAIEDALGIYTVITGEEGFAESIIVLVDTTMNSLGYLNSEDAPELSDAKLNSWVDVLSLMAVDMTDLFEYDEPSQIPEWVWIEQHHSFAHTRNWMTPGVYELMVHVSDEDDNWATFYEGVPESLKPYFAHAKATGINWIMFHQG